MTAGTSKRLMPGQGRIRSRPSSSAECLKPVCMTLFYVIFAFSVNRFVDFNALFTRYLLQQKQLVTS